jgi:hypothetical protein
VSELKELGIYDEAPRAARLTQAVNRILLFLIAPPVRVVWSLSGVIAIAIVISRPARDAVERTWFSITLVALAVIAEMLIGVLMVRKAGLIRRFVLGRPVFGKVGGSPVRVVRASIRAASEAELEFDAADRKVMDEVADFMRDATESTFRDQFHRVERERDASDEEGGEDRWREVWKGVLSTRIGNIAIGEFLDGRSHSFLVLGPKFRAVLALVEPLLMAYWIVVVWLVAGALFGDGTLLPALQAGLVVSVMISSVVFLNHVIGLGAKFPIETEQLLARLPQELHARALKLGEKEVTPRGVKLSERYYSIVRDFMGQTLLRQGLVATGNLTPLIALCGVAAAMFAPGSLGSVLRDYGVLLLSLPCILVGLLFGHYLTFLVLENVRQFLAPVIGGAAAAGVPLVAEYLATGAVQADQRTIVTSVISGVLGAVVTGVTNRIKDAVPAK